jgi:hypothetical protein
MRWLESEIKILKENYEMNGPDFCSKILDIEKSKVVSKANYLGLKTSKKNRSENKNKPKINFNLFSTNFNEDSVYILGLLWADGYINKNKTTSISCIQSDMDDVVEIFKRTGEWKISNKIKKYHDGCEVNSQIKISTTTWDLYETLKKYGFHNKSFLSPNILLNEIPKKLHKYWYRGYLDGDGCIRLGKNRGMSVVFTSTYEQDWEFMKLICDELKISYKVYQVIQKQGKSSNLVIHRKNDVKKFLDFIYNDYNGIGFKRKYEKYKKIIDYISLKTKHFWQESEIKFLIENYKIIGAKECSRVLNKTLHSIYNKIRLINHLF